MANDGPVIPWSTVVITAMLIATATGAGWQVFQTQFSSINAAIEENKRQVEKTFAILQAQLDRRVDVLDKQTSSIHSTYISTKELLAFQDNIFNRLDRLRERIMVLEQTRPTTGELQATLRIIEQYLNDKRGKHNE